MSGDRSCNLPTCTKPPSPLVASYVHRGYCSAAHKAEHRAETLIIEWLRKIGSGKMTHPSLRDWIMAPGGLANSIERGEHRAS
jgi:hypothetical protein